MNIKSTVVYLGLMAVSGITFLQAQITQPVPLPVPPAPFVTISNGQIDRLTMTTQRALAPITLPKPIGPACSITLWVRLNPSPSLDKTGFGGDHPVTLVNFHPVDRQSNYQQLVLRIDSGCFQAYELNHGQWRRLEGNYPHATPGTWHFLAYTRSATGGVFYVNGEIAGRTRVNPPVHDWLQVLSLGHFEQRRLADGILVRPRLYLEALTNEQIDRLYQQRPPEIR